MMRFLRRAAPAVLVSLLVGCDGSTPAPLMPRYPVETMELAVAAQFEPLLAAVDADPDDVEALGRLGMLYHAYGFKSLAEDCYRGAARADDDHTSVWSGYLGRVLSERGRWEEASEILSTRLSAGDPAAAVHLMEALRRLGDLEGALELARAADPADPRAQCVAGRALLDLGRPDEARDALRNAVELAGGRYGTAQYALGLTLRVLRRPDEATQMLEEAERNATLEPPITDPLMQAVTTLRRGAIHALHLGIETLASGDTRGAIDLLDQAVRIEPTLTEAHSQLGAAYLAIGDIDLAAASLDRALEIDPFFVDAIYNRGVVAHRRQAPDRAAEYFAAALERRPSHIDARLGLGTDLALLGSFEEALTHLRICTTRRPADPRGPKRLAEALHTLGRDAEAVEVLSAACERMAGDLSIVDRLAWRLATSPDPAVLDPSRAVILARRVTESVRRASTMDTLAAALAAKGDFEEASRWAGLAHAEALRRGDHALASSIDERRMAYRAKRGFTDRPGSM